MNQFFKSFIACCMVFFHAVSHCSDQQRTLTLAESIVVGGVVGAAEVVFPGQILSYAMNQAIKRESFALSKSYHGFAANALGQMPITAIQKVVQTKGSEQFEAWQNRKLSDKQQVAVSYTAGVCGALVDTPSNAVQLYMQEPKNAGKTMRQAFMELGTKSYRGFAPNAFLKEGMFAVGYQMMAGKATQKVQPYVGDNLASAALGGAGAGVVTAVITHPGAVLRNKMQADPNKTMYTTTWQTVQKIYKQEGAAGFFTGLKQRGARVAVAVPLYAAYSAYLQDMIKK